MSQHHGRMKSSIGLEGGKVNDYSDGLLKLNSLFGEVFKKQLGLFMMT